MKFNVFGRVILDSQHEPVPNVMVSVFDQNDQSPTSENNVEVADSFPREVIGTAITDSDGKFALEFTEQDFRDGTERRPDLLVAVFAPLTSNLDGQAPPPAQERLLHFSKYPWMNAGSQEGLVIMLSFKRLAELGLVRQPVAVEETPIDEQLLAGVRSRKEIRRKVRTAAKRTIARDSVEDFKLQEQARKFADSFSPMAKRSSTEAFLIPDTYRGDERESFVREVIENAHEAGADRFSSIPRPRVFINPPEYFRERHPEIDLGTVSTPVTFDNVCDLLRESVGGTSLLRTRTLRDAEERLQQLRGTADESTSDGGDGGPTDGTVTGGEEGVEPAATVSERIKQLVEQQVADVVMSAPPEEKLPQLPLERIKAELAEAELGAGPADTTAYHDFHAVQLAYPDIWEESVNPEFRGLIGMIYRLANRVARDTGLESDEVLTGEISDLEDFVNTVGSRVDSIIAIGAASIHEDIIFLFPILASTWHLLLPERQNWIAEQLTPKLFNAPPYADLDAGQTPRELVGSEWQMGLRSNAEFLERLGHGGFNERRQVALQRLLVVEAWLETVDWSALEDAPESSETTGVASPIARLKRMLSELADMIGKEPYSFEYYAKESYNFGIVVTYRQKWEPGPYQVGDMVSTIPLAPGERRVLEVRESVTTKREMKEMERASWARSSERSNTMRYSEDVVRRAQSATNFSMNTQGSFSIGPIGQIQVSSGFGANQSTFSQTTKKDFREAVIKASHDYRNERSLEVSTGQERVEDTKTVAELSNPNNEVPVTYLLYELERQFKITEKIHQLQPVILVAQPMPAANKITEAWLLRHEWILRRVLLDDSLLGALDQLHNSFASEEVAISVLKANWETQVRVVEKLEGDHGRWVKVRDRLNESLTKARFAERQAEAMEEAGGFLYDIGSSLAAFNPLGAAEGAIEARRKMLEEQMEWANSELQRSAEQLSGARESLNLATKDYRDGLEARTQQRTQIDQLRIHVKDNILHYMQAIWSHEPSDQRYFRLHKVPVRLPQAEATVCTVRAATPEEGGHPIPGVPFRDVVIEDCEITGITFSEMPLHKVAELDRPLGFKGNYMMFPLKECTTITDFMMLDYVDTYFGIRDPDPLSDFTTEELTEYRRNLTDEEKTAVDRIIANRLSANGRDQDIVVMPTGQLYMEALVGSHTLLEPFKLAHRGYDAAIAREELRRTGLENLRYASRLLAEEPLLEDPETDTRIEVSGDPDVDVTPPSG